MKNKYKFKPRQEVLYYWPAKNDYFKAVILKHVNLNESNPEMNHYQVRILNYQDNSWSMTAQESSLSELETPNKLMKDLV